MNGNEIQSLVSKDVVLKNQFLGVFAADELPDYIPVGKGLIVNCCKRSLPGIHWVALYRPSSKRIEFFDSFGRDPWFYGLNINTFDTIQYNNVQLQNVFSNVCGLYCILYLFQRVRGNQMSKVVNMFSRNNTTFNDRLVKSKICTYFY